MAASTPTRPSPSLRSISVDLMGHWRSLLLWMAAARRAEEQRTERQRCAHLSDRTAVREAARGATPAATRFSLFRQSVRNRPWCTLHSPNGGANRCGDRFVAKGGKD